MNGTLYFALLAGVLVLASLGALLWAASSRRRLAAIHVPPLPADVYRDELRELEADRSAGTLSDSDYQSARDELEQRVIEESSGEDAALTASLGVRRTDLLLIPVLVIGLSVGGYAMLGAPRALQTENPMGYPVDDVQVARMVAELASRLEKDQDDPGGWLMLARSYAVLTRFAEADAAFGRITGALAEDPQVLADWVEAKLLAAEGAVGPEVERLLEKAQAVSPDHPKVLMMSGSAAFLQQRFADAVRHWQKLLPQLDPASEEARYLTRSLAEAHERAKAEKAVKPSPGAT